MVAASAIDQNQPEHNGCKHHQLWPNQTLFTLKQIHRKMISTCQSLSRYWSSIPMWIRGKLQKMVAHQARSWIANRKQEPKYSRWPQSASLRKNLSVIARIFLTNMSTKMAINLPWRLFSHILNTPKTYRRTMASTNRKQTHTINLRSHLWIATQIRGFWIWCQLKINAILLAKINEKHS